MNPLKQRTPAATPPGPHSLENNISDKGNNTSNPSHGQSCRQCAFYEDISLKGGHVRRLCHCTGLKMPYIGMAGCCFIAGKWDPERINYLTAYKSKNILAIPNLMRPCNGLDHSQDGQKVARHFAAIHSIAGISGNRIDHIGRAQRPGSGDTRAASSRLGSVGALPFCF